MVDEIYDRAYQDGRAELHAGVLGVAVEGHVAVRGGQLLGHLDPQPGR